MARTGHSNNLISLALQDNYTRIRIPVSQTEEELKVIISTEG